MKDREPQRQEATAEPAVSRRRINQVNHNKNLHGAEGVWGLTGFYHTRYYLRGVHQPKRR